MPHSRDPIDVAFELRARGYADSAQEARHMVIHEPRVVRALLRFHDVPAMLSLTNPAHPGGSTIPTSNTGR